MGLLAFLEDTVKLVTSAQWGLLAALASRVPLDSPVCMEQLVHEVLQAHWVCQVCGVLMEALEFAALSTDFSAALKKFADCAVS